MGAEDEVRIEVDAGWRAGAAARPATAGEPAGFWRRGLALGVDIAVVWVLLRAGDLLALPLARLDLVARAFGITWDLVVPAAYFVLGHGTAGQTPGKRLLGVRVVGLGGERLGYWWSLGRLLAAGFSVAVLFGLGFLFAAFRDDRRALHDLIAGTRVVRSR